MMMLLFSDGSDIAFHIAKFLVVKYNIHCNNQIHAILNTISLGYLCCAVLWSHILRMCIVYVLKEPHGNFAANI